MKTLRSSWTSLILHTTAFIHRKKEELSTLHAGKAFLGVISLILAELFLAIISFPLYLATEPTTGKDAEVHEFHVRRIVTLSLVWVILLIWFIKLMAILLISFYFQPQEWNIQHTGQIETLEEELLTTSAHLAKVDTTLPIPTITDVQQTRNITVVKGITAPHETVIIVLSKISEDSKATGPRMYRGEANATGQFTVTEDNTVFYTAPGTYIAQAFVYNKKLDAKGSPSDGVQFTLRPPVWKHIFGAFDRTLNFSVLLFLVFGVGITLLTSQRAPSKT